MSVSALTGEKCYHELFSLTDEEEMGHIKLARSADLVLVAPATGNFMAKAAAGIADDLNYSSNHDQCSNRNGARHEPSNVGMPQLKLIVLFYENGAFT